MCLHKLDQHKKISDVQLMYLLLLTCSHVFYWPIDVYAYNYWCTSRDNVPIPANTPVVIKQFLYPLEMLTDVYSYASITVNLS